MTGRERLKATLAGDRPDRLPLCLWHHFRPAESPAWLADATLHFFGELGFDIIKVMPDLPYPPPAGGPLRSAADWRPLPVLRAEPGGDLAGIPETVALLRQAQPDAVIVATVFSPLALALRFTGGATTLRAMMHEDKDALLAGFDTLAQNVAAQCTECLARGADGIYFATNGLGDELLSADEYATLGRPYDLRVLDACVSGWCNVVHLHAAANLHWELVADYPSPILSWSDRQTGVTLREVAQALPGKTLMGGIDETGAIVRGDSDGLAAEVKDAVAQVAGRRLILAGGCSVPDDIPFQHLTTARILAERLTSTTGRQASGTV